MLNQAALYLSSFFGVAFVLAAIAIGVTVRVALIIQPKERFQSYLHLFSRSRGPGKNSTQSLRASLALPAAGLQ